MQKKADTVITQGATQSNHVRQTAAICAKIGLRCEIILEHRKEVKILNIWKTAMCCLTGLFGASIKTVPAGTDMDAALEESAEEIQKNGKFHILFPVEAQTQ
ncbi:MAG: hypothetical protein CM1200mP28_08260 [Deltaproteobacteria bacterium]|nr:MAG: hypothetical protein CM1200mP28_08260 [Deltaproteobacteria bacterium]